MLDIQKAHSYTRRNSCLTDLLAGVVRHPQIRSSGGMSMFLSKWCLRSLFLLAFLLAVSYAASAQYRAGIQGTVLDPQGAVIDGAKVTVTANETGLSQETTTDDKGVYSVNRLAPGLYTISVEKGGFKKESLESVNIIGDQVTSVNVTLQLGQVAESVTVNADELPAIDTESGQIEGTITGKQIQALPSFGRDVFQLLQLGSGRFGDVS